MKRKIKGKIFTMVSVPVMLLLGSIFLFNAIFSQVIDINNYSHMNANLKGFTCNARSRTHGKGSHCDGR